MLYQELIIFTTDILKPGRSTREETKYWQKFCVLMVSPFFANTKGTVSREPLKKFKSEKTHYSNENLQEVVHFRKNNNASAMKLKK